VASAFARMEEAEVPFDVIHDNCGFTAFAFADRIDTPLVHTLHGPFTDETKAFYARHAYKARAVALSRYQADRRRPSSTSCRGDREPDRRGGLPVPRGARTTTCSGSAG
jgi:hypothetical protein